MPAPREIVDALESVLDIFLSDIRHRERAAFILWDNLVEMACKRKAKQAGADHLLSISPWPTALGLW